MVSLVTRLQGEKHENTLVRVTCQRLVWNTNDKISNLEQLDEPKPYQDFLLLLQNQCF